MLPTALKEAISRAVQGLAHGDIAPHSEKLSDHYRRGGTSNVLADRLGIAAYLLVRLPATYAATHAVLAEAARRAPDFAPKCSLDIGAGPGTASWAAADVWPEIETARLVDSNPRLLEVARALMADCPVPAFARPQIVNRDIETAALASADLVIAGYSLGEIPADRLVPAVCALWEACTGLLVVVEPGTPAGFDRVRAARSILIDRGAAIVAPCPHRLACPIAAPDWCHFSERLPRSRGHMLAKSVSVPFEDEKYSYVVAAREGIAVEPYAARIMGPVRRSKVGLTMKLCEAGEVRTRIVAARDRQAFSRHRRAAWGDALKG
jgi:ribosomal protein RSM22 (predicted rRNA methylase)